jgi:OOP family OmpA-OmpF porin
MRAKHLVVSLLVLVLGMVLTSCTMRPVMESGLVDTTCSNADTNAMLKSGDYKEKINNFLLVQDASSTMSESWGKTFHYDSSKLEISKELVRCLNNTLPDNFDVNAGMRAFGPVYSEKGLIYGMTDYTKAGLMNAVNSTGKTGGVTPLANAVTYAGHDLLATPGKKAMILFSDGLNTDPANPAAAAAAVREMHGDNICIYTVLIGHSPQGRATMQQIADAGICGFATDNATIGNAQGMSKFVTDVFLAKVMRKPAPVPAPAPVMKKPVEKISISLFIEFDFDKDVIRPDQHDDAKMIADALNKYPQAEAQLEGHTDSMGDDAYNMDLSKRRANSVKNYVVEKFNIKASRISTVGYGESKPVATNDTDAGRQKNRRVVANIK